MPSICDHVSPHTCAHIAPSTKRPSKIHTRSICLAFSHPSACRQATEQPHYLRQPNARSRVENASSVRGKCSRALVAMLRHLPKSPCSRSLRLLMPCSGQVSSCVLWRGYSHRPGARIFSSTPVSTIETHTRRTRLHHADTPLHSDSTTSMAQKEPDAPQVAT